jgi:hypothetical protein
MFLDNALSVSVKRARRHRHKTLPNHAFPVSVPALPNKTMSVAVVLVDKVPQMLRPIVQQLQLDVHQLDLCVAHGTFGNR